MTRSHNSGTLGSPFTGLRPKEDRPTLERRFKNPLTPHRLHTGPAGPFLDGFAESMGAAGYSSETIGPYLHAADHLGQWAAQRRVAVADLDEDLLAHFLRHLSRRPVATWMSRRRE